MSDEVKETLKLISYRKKNSILVGSQNQKAVKYKNDYDLYETIVLNESREQFILDVHNLFIKMVKGISKNKNIYFIEFKGGIYQPLYITDEDLLNKTRRLAFYKQALQNDDISPQIFEIITNIKSKDELLNFCSNLYKVRWSIQNILEGRVVLFNSKTFYFKDIFNQPSVIKIDVMLFDNTEMRFIPFSNFFEFINKDKEINFTQQNIQESLQAEADDLARNGNYYKSIKRLYSLALYNKDKKQAAKYLDIINSLAGALYFVRGNVENCIEVLTRYKKQKTIEQIHIVLLNLLESFNFSKIIVSFFNKALNKKTQYGLLKALVNLEAILNKTTQEYTKSLL
jgi:hypothetical protein